MCINEYRITEKKLMNVPFKEGGGGGSGGGGGDDGGVGFGEEVLVLLLEVVEEMRILGW